MGFHRWRLLAWAASLWLCSMAGAAPGDAPARAPALRGREWLNSRPLGREDLTGKVVLIEFWTFDCINCRRTFLAMNRLHALYREGGDVVIVGVHTPELPHERGSEAVARAVAREKLTYPVLIDDAGLNWKAFGNHYWPALYVIDRAGRIRDLHIGELHEDTHAWRSLIRLIDSLRRDRS